MARRSNMRTPKTPANPASDDEDSSDVNALGPSSEGLAAEEAHDGQIIPLGNDLPSAPAHLSDAHYFDADHTPGEGILQDYARFDVGTMGANNSREEVSAAVNATAEALQGRNAPRQSTGKLKRPSTGATNPPYRNPTSKAVPAVRRMKPSQHARPDTYELQDSPEKPVQKRGTQAQRKDFSPLKKQKVVKVVKQTQPRTPALSSLEERYTKEQQALDDQLLSSQARVEQEPASEPVSRNPRRSRWHQEGEKELEQAVPGSGRSASIASSAKDAAEINTQAAHTKNWFRDTAPHEDGEGEEHQGVSVTHRRVSHVEVTSDPPAQLEAEVAAAGQPEDDMLQPTPAKHKGGRPPKQKPARPSSGGGETGANTKTRAQMAASAPPQKLKPKKQNSTRAQRGINAQSARQAEAKRKEQEAASAAEQAEHGDGEGQRDAEENIGVAGPVAGVATADADDEDDYQPEGQEDHDDDDAENDEEDEELPAQPLSKKVDRVRPSELFAGATGDAFQSSPEKQDQRTARKRKQHAGDSSAADEQRTSRKRKQPAEDGSAAANTSKKRKKQRFAQPEHDNHPSPQSDEDAEASPQPEPEEGRRNANRFYGQWKTLRKISKATEIIGVNHKGGEPLPQRKIRLRNAEVVTIVNLCNEAMDKLSSDEDPAADFAHIGERVDELYIADEESEPDFKDVSMSKDIHAHLFPKLVQLLRHTVEHYEENDVGDSADSRLTPGHLRTVIDLIKLILDLGDGAKKYDNPPPELALLKPVQNGIIAPLKPMHAALKRELRRHDDIAHHKATQQRLAAFRVLATQREAQEERRTAHAKRVRDKWHQLHLERIYAEGGIPTQQKRRHLALPIADEVEERDHNGLPFERLEVFGPRIGPSPALVEQARQNNVWSMPELAALEEGLQKYMGEMVFEKIFRRYCPRKQLLNRYNVTEIVTCAADLKEFLAGMQAHSGGEVEDWVRGIPVWTRGFAGGKENVVGQDDGVDDEGGES